MWLALGLGIPACALAPPNDRCQNAEVLDTSVLPVQLMGTTLEAGDDARSILAPASSGGRDVVFRFTLSSPISLVIETTGSAFDTVLSLWRECDSGALVEETAANDDFDGVASRLDLLNLAAGEYYILVDGFDTSQAGVFFLTLRAPSPPPNDTCAEAQSIPLESTTFGSTLGAVNDSLQVCSSTITNGPDVFYRIIVDEPMDLVVDTLGSELDTVLTIREGLCSGPIVACNDNFESLDQSLVTILDAAPGVPYFVQLDSAASDAGTFQINLHRRTEPPSNDACQSSLPAVDIPATLSGSTRFATNDEASIQFGGAGPDVVFKVDLTNGESVFIDSLGSTFDTILYARQGSCNGPEVAANDGVLGKRTARLVMSGLPSGTYYVFLDGKTPADRGDYVLKFDRGTPPPNDDCATAELVAIPGVRTGSIRLANDSENSNISNCANEGPDVVFRFSLAEPRNLLFSTLGTQFDTVLYLKSGDCANSQFVACNDDGNGSFGVNSYIDDFEQDALTPGDYLLYLDSFEDSDGEYTLQIIDLSTPTPIPSATRTPTRTATRTGTPSRTLTQTGTATPSLTSNPSPTATPTATLTRSATPSATSSPTGPVPTATSTETHSQTPTRTETGTTTATFTFSPTVTASATTTLSPTETEIGAPTATETETPSPTETASPTQTNPIPETPTETSTVTETETPTPTSTAEEETPSATPTSTEPDETPTTTETHAETWTETPTESDPTATATPVYDLDQNGAVGSSDLILFLAERMNPGAKTGPLGDFNGDALIDGLDLFLFSYQWRTFHDGGEFPGPSRVGHLRPKGAK